MSLTNVLPLLLGLFSALGAGFVVRATNRVPERAHETLHALILEITMPALIVYVLHDQHLDPSMGLAVIASCGALIASMLIATFATRALGMTTKAQGSAGICASFSNTGFLGVPIVLSVFGDRPGAAATAVIIDSISTTLLLWTLGVAWASNFGGDRRFDLTALASLVKLPVTWAVMIGLILSITGIGLPSMVASTLKTIGTITGVLVFLSLGMQLDLRSLKGNARGLAVVGIVKLVVSPCIAFALVRLLGIHGVGAQVAVVQSSMPSAMVGAIVAARYGCDGPLASAASVLTTLGALATLPAVFWALGP